MTNPRHTHIAVILDASSSMQALADETIAGLNSFLADQRKAEGFADVTLVQFASKVETTFLDVPLAVLADLTDERYKPAGFTALNDAIGMTIDELGKRLAGKPDDKRPGQVIVVVITDGHENASRTYAHPQIVKMIERQRADYGWRFVFLGADPSAVQTGASMGMGSDASMSYTPTAGGVQSLYKTASAAVLRSRSTNADVSFSAAERAANDPGTH